MAYQTVYRPIITPKHSSKIGQTTKWVATRMLFVPHTHAVGVWLASRESSPLAVAVGVVSVFS